MSLINSRGGLGSNYTHVHYKMVSVYKVVTTNTCNNIFEILHMISLSHMHMHISAFRDLSLLSSHTRVRVS